MTSRIGLAYACPSSFRTASSTSCSTSPRTPAFIVILPTYQALYIDKGREPQDHEHDLSLQSSRSARTGSIRLARTAGVSAPAAATETITVAAAVQTMG